MTGPDLAAFAHEIALSTKSYVATVVAGIVGDIGQKLVSLEQALADVRDLKAQPGPSGKDGSNGKDGRDGIDGKDGSPGLAGKDGIDGAPGANGRDGVDGRPGLDGKDGSSVTLADVLPVMQAQLEQRIPELVKAWAPAGPPGLTSEEVRAILRVELATLPPPRDGRDGQPGAPGPAGKDGINGKDGRDGIDGKDGAAGLNGKDGRDGIDGKDGAPGLHGKDGRDAFEVGDFSLVDGLERGLMLRAQRDDVVKDVPLPAMVDRGVWRHGLLYHQGACVTKDGALWVALRASPSLGKPGDPDSGWRLCVKAGRDGKDGKDLRGL